MTEIPQFKEPLRNPDVSEEADRQLDKLMDQMPAEAARRLVPEFAALEPAPKKKYQIAAERRLPRAQAILSNIEASTEERLAREKEADEARRQEAVELMAETDPHKPISSDHEAV